MSELWRGYKELPLTVPNPNTCPYSFEDTTAVGVKRCKYCGQVVGLKNYDERRGGIDD